MIAKGASEIAVPESFCSPGSCASSFAPQAPAAPGVGGAAFGQPGDSTTVPGGFLNGQGRLTALSDADGDTTRFGYDSSGNLTSLTDPDRNTTTWSYNGQNQVTQETVSSPLPSGEDEGSGSAPFTATATFGYNSSSQLVSYTDMDGGVRTYQYDSAGHVISETLYPTAADATAGQNAEDTLHYGYDNSGNLTSESDDSSSDTYTYDGQNRLTSASETSVDSPTVVLTYEYSGASTQPSGVSATIDGVADYQDAYTYNAQGELTEIVRSGVSGGDAVADETVDLTYNAAGQVQSIDRYQGGQLAVEANYSYDSAGRLTDLVYRQGTTILASYAYAYAGAGSAGVPALAGQTGSQVLSGWLPSGAMLPATSTQGIDTAGLDQAVSPEDLVASGGTKGSVRDS